MPPWMQGTPYDYAAALQAGWYLPPMAPYPPFYQPTMHPLYCGSYTEGAPQASYNVQQAAVIMGQTIQVVSVEATEQLTTSMSQHRSDRLSLMSLLPVQAWMYLMLRALVHVCCRSPLTTSPAGWTVVSIGDIRAFQS